MIRSIAALLAALLILTPALAQAPAVAWNDARVAGWIDGAMRTAMEQNRVAGGTVAVVKDGRVLLAKGYGVARLTPRPQAADADTLFQVASISKTPVYIAIMQLAEAGALKLDDPANAHLPKALQIPDQGFTKPILIRHLMTHSAGFEDSALGHLFVKDPAKLRPIDRYLVDYRLSRVREPGLQTSYSNYALTLLGAIVAHKSGMDFPTYMETRILRPLGLTRATYREPYAAALAQRLKLPAPMDPAVAANITQQIGGPVGAREILGPEWTTMIAPAGGLRASANDMAAYLLALSDPVKLEAAGVLKAASFAQLLQPGVPLPGTRRTGFMHYDFDGGRTGFGHGGAMLFGASDLIVVPDQNLGVFVSTNGRGGFAFANDLVRRLLRDFAPLPETPASRTRSVKAMAEEMAGDWIYNRRAWTRTERAILMFDAAFTVTPQPNGDLVIADVAGDGFRMEPLGDGIWRSADRMSQRLYAPDADGTPTIWNGSGTGSAVRAGAFERPRMVLGILVLTLVFASVAVWRGVLRLVARRPRGDKDAAGPLLPLAAALVWALAIGGFLTVLAQSIPDGGAALVLAYPSPVNVIAWGTVLALVLTLAALAGAPRAIATKGWTLWRRAKHLGLLALFLFAAFTCWRIGLLGFSDY